MLNAAFFDQLDAAVELRHHSKHLILHPSQIDRRLLGQRWLVVDCGWELHSSHTVPQCFQLPKRHSSRSTSLLLIGVDGRRGRSRSLLTPIVGVWRSHPEPSEKRVHRISQILVELSWVRGALNRRDHSSQVAQIERRHKGNWLWSPLSFSLSLLPLLSLLALTLLSALWPFIGSWLRGRGLSWTAGGWCPGNQVNCQARAVDYLIYFLRCSLSF